MGIAPIDLQTLFSQVDKVGKIQASQREGQILQQAIHSVQIQRKTEEQIQQVNEAQDTGEGAEKVNDGQRQNSGGGNKGKGQKEAKKDEELPSVSREPNLGRQIDISL